MPTELKLRRGTTAQHSTFTGASGEITVDTSKKTVVVHDGSTAGGVPLATEAAVNAKQNSDAELTTLAGMSADRASFLASTQPFSMRNRIINGDMRIDQRNNGASVTLGAGNIYTLDRFAVQSGNGSRLSAQQNAGSVTPPAGFRNYLGLTSLSAYSVPAGEIFSLRQYIEGFNVADLGWGAAGAQTVTLSFWVRSSLTGTFGGSVNNNSNRSYPFTYTISAANTWEQKNITIPGDTSGTWATGNTTGLLLELGLGVGSTFSGTAGAWAGSYFSSATGATSVVGTNGATFYITGVQLEAGSVATPFERRDYGRELMMCQRYYWQGFHSVYTQGGNTTSLMMIAYPATMRASPTANWSVWIYSNVASFTVNGLQTTGARSVVGSTGAGSAEWTGTVFLSAEL